MIKKSTKKKHGPKIQPEISSVVLIVLEKTPLVIPDTATVHVGKGVMWRIYPKTVLHESHKVELKNFRLVPPPARPSPPAPPPTPPFSKMPSRVKLGALKPHADTIGIIDSSATKKRCFKYEVWVDGLMALDPQIVVAGDVPLPGEQMAKILLPTGKKTTKKKARKKAPRRTGRR